MTPKRYSLTLNSYDYSILKNNSLITTCCGSILKQVKIKDNEVKLLLTKDELKELTGFVAAEANHAISKTEEEGLGEIFGSLVIPVVFIYKKDKLNQLVIDFTPISKIIKMTKNLLDS